MSFRVFVDDVAAGERWYVDVLGIEPYFRSKDVGLPAGHVGLRVNAYQAASIARELDMVGESARLNGAILRARPKALTVLRSNGFTARRLEDGFPKWRLVGLQVEVREANATEAASDPERPPARKRALL